MNCEHPQDAVFYNPYNHVTQCHRCGEIMPDDRDSLKRQIEELQGRYDMLASRPIDIDSLEARRFSAYLEHVLEAVGFS